MSDALDIVERLRARADDPMWAHHAEIPKRWCDEAADEITRLRALSAQPAAVPGWQLVPVEPTPEMRYALESDRPPEVRWARALAAAPQAPQQDEAGE